jgi:non-ribosomal peptide synthetase component F
LNTRANQLARQLRRQGIGPDCLVGIALARSPEMMVALLAVLKAGAAYLPLDPDYPAERLVHMLRDSGTRLILTESDQLKLLSSVLDQIAVETFCIDKPSLFGEEDTGNLNIEVHPDSLA